MKKILLVCAAGMSTSLLVSRMKKHAEALNEEVDMIALACIRSRDCRVKRGRRTAGAASQVPKVTG
jgi:cellobiose-specific phosphotransferase system component IIB